MPGEDPEIDENGDSVADSPEAVTNEGVKRKTGSQGEKRNRKIGPCYWWNGCGGGHIMSRDIRDQGKYEIRFYYYFFHDCLQPL